MTVPLLGAARPSSQHHSSQHHSSQQHFTPQHFTQQFRPAEAVNGADGAISRQLHFWGLERHWWKLARTTRPLVQAARLIAASTVAIELEVRGPALLVTIRADHHHLPPAVQPSLLSIAGIHPAGTAEHDDGEWLSATIEVAI